MKQEVIQDFLNLPGISGLALMDGRSRPYFFGVDRALNFQQKEALAQGIMQVIETIPDGFESFEFQFTGHQVHIYKLEHGIILLVLTGDDLVYSDYLKTIKNLKAALASDLTNAIATFRLIAGNLTLPGVQFHPSYSPIPNRNNGGPVSTPPVPPSPSPHSPQATQSPESERSQSERSQSTPPAPAPTSRTPTSSTSSASNSAATRSTGPDPTIVAATLKDLLTALNLLSKFTTQYLGTHVIVNYWKSTCPDREWLKNLTIDRTGQFTFTNPPSDLNRFLTAEEQMWIQEWVAAFIQRCSRVIRDFSTLTEKSLTSQQKALLFGATPPPNSP